MNARRAYVSDTKKSIMPILHGMLPSGKMSRWINSIKTKNVVLYSSGRKFWVKALTKRLDSQWSYATSTNSLFSRPRPEIDLKQTECWNGPRNGIMQRSLSCESSWKQFGVNKTGQRQPRFAAGHCLQTTNTPWPFYSSFPLSMLLDLQANCQY